MTMYRTTIRAFAAAVALGVFAMTPALAEFTDTDIRAIQSFTKRMLERAKTGSSTTWRNGDGSVGGRVTITTTDHQPGAQPCRTYEWTMRRQGGAEMTGIGRGCRDGAGGWTLEESRSERQTSIDPPPAPAKVYPPNSGSKPTETTSATRSIKPERSPKPTATEKSAASADEATESAEEKPEGDAATTPQSPAEQLAELKFTYPPRTLNADTGAASKAPNAEGAQ